MNINTKQLRNALWGCYSAEDSDCVSRIKNLIENMELEDTELGQELHQIRNSEDLDNILNSNILTEKKKKKHKVFKKEGNFDPDKGVEMFNHATTINNSSSTPGSSENSGSTSSDGGGMGESLLTEDEYEMSPDGVLVPKGTNQKQKSSNVNLNTDSQNDTESQGQYSDDAEKVILLQKYQEASGAEKTQLKQKLTSAIKKEFAQKKLITDNNLLDTVFECIEDNENPFSNDFYKFLKELKVVPQFNNLDTLYDMWKSGQVGPNLANKQLDRHPVFLNSKKLWGMPKRDFQFTAKILDVLTDRDKAKKYFQDIDLINKNAYQLFDKNDIKEAGIGEYKVGKDNIGKNIYTIVDQWQKINRAKDQETKSKTSSTDKRVNYSRQEQDSIANIQKAINNNQTLTDKQLKLIAKLLNQLEPQKSK